MMNEVVDLHDGVEAEVILLQSDRAGRIKFGVMMVLLGTMSAVLAYVVVTLSRVLG